MDGQVNNLHVAVDVDVQIAAGCRLAAAHRLGQRQREFMPDSFARHGMDVPVCLAGGGFQVLAGAAVDVEQVASAVDQNGGRRKLLQQHLIGQGLQIGADGGDFCIHWTLARGGGMAGGEFQTQGGQGAEAALEQAGFAIQRGE